MDIFFTDPEDVPLPPDEVRIRDLEVIPYPDGRRIRLLMEFTPFQKYPSGEVTIMDSLGNPSASASFIEAITPKLEMTLHLRNLDPNGKYDLAMILFYSQEIEDEQQGEQKLVRSEKKIVDEKKIHFVIELDRP
jgi:hypothetical protein